MLIKRYANFSHNNKSKHNLLVGAFFTFVVFFLLNALIEEILSALLIGPLAILVIWFFKKASDYRRKYYGS